MEMTKLSDQFSVCGQLQPVDLDEIKAQGFRSVLCVRPDDEAEDQPSFAQIEASARAKGLATAYVPVDASGAQPGDHAAFAKAMAKLPGPVLAYCRSGQRAAKLWQTQQDAAA